jgi:hypothetical protein
MHTIPYETQLQDQSVFLAYVKLYHLGIWDFKFPSITKFADRF